MLPHPPLTASEGRKGRERMMEVAIKVKKDDWIELVIYADEDIEWVALKSWLDQYADGKAGVEIIRQAVDEP